MNIPFLLQAAELLPVGSSAPVVAILDQNGKPFDLAAAYQKGMTIVYFYPKADTPGCTAQACSLRDDSGELSKLGVQVIGVSKDSPEAQKKFQEKYHLPFPLLADDKRELGEAFGVGAMLGFSNRTSFLIKDGKIVWCSPKAQTKEHAKEVEEALAKLATTGSKKK